MEPMKLFLAFWMVVSTSLSAFGSGIRKIDPGFAAQSAASFLNGHKSGDELINFIQGYYTDGEIADSRELFVKAGINLNEKMPPTKVKGDAVTFGGSKMIFFPDRSFSINGNVYRPLGKPLDVFLKQVLDQEKRGQTSGFSFLPVAHAAGFVAAGLLGLAGVAIAAGKYYKAEVAETLKDHEMVCNGDNFGYRRKTHNNVGYATHKVLSLDSKVLVDIFEREDFKCNKDTIDELVRAVRPLDLNNENELRKKLEDAKRRGGLE